MITHNKRSIQLCINTTPKQLFWFWFLGSRDFLFVWVFSPFFSSLNEIVCNGMGGEEERKRTFGETVFLINIVETLLQHYSYLFDFNASVCGEIK